MWPFRKKPNTPQCVHEWDKWQTITVRIKRELAYTEATAVQKRFCKNCGIAELNTVRSYG